MAQVAPPKPWEKLNTSSTASHQPSALATSTSAIASTPSTATAAAPIVPSRPAQIAESSSLSTFAVHLETFSFILPLGSSPTALIDQESQTPDLSRPHSVEKRV